MNWKKVLSSVLLHAAGLFVFFMFRYPKDVLLPGSAVFIANVIESFALSLGIVGSNELETLGYPRVRSTLIFCIIPISLFLFFVLIIWGGYSGNWLYAISALWAAPFPVSLYLNHHQKNSTSQPTIANAS